MNVWVYDFWDGWTVIEFWKALTRNFWVWLSDEFVGVWGGSFSCTAAIFDWAPLLLKTMAMMIGIDLGVKTLNIIPFLFLSTAY